MEALDRFEGGAILHTTLALEIVEQLSEAIEDETSAPSGVTRVQIALRRRVAHLNWHLSRASNRSHRVESRSGREMPAMSKPG